MSLQEPECGSTITVTERESSNPVLCTVGVEVRRKPILYRCGQSVIDTGTLAPIFDSIGCAFEVGDMATSLAIETLYVTVDGPARLPVPLAVTGDTSNISKTFALMRNSTNLSTVIQYQLPKESNVTIRAYSVPGQGVATMVNGKEAARAYEMTFDMDHYASGICFVGVFAGNYTYMDKMMLLK